MRYGQKQALRQMLEECDKADKQSRYIYYQGQAWELGEITETSDGFMMASGFAVGDDGEPLVDADGYEIFHSFFLGQKAGV